MKLQPKIFLAFLGWFLLIYVLLIIPWPGWNAAYDSYFQAMGRTAFSRDGEKRVILFMPHQDPKHPLGSRMSLANREQLDSNGNGHAATIDLDTRSIGWIPTALIIALIVATPIPWKRRAWALLWGLIWIHLFILFSLLSWIWQQSPALGLTTLSSFWKQAADGLEYTLITQLGASFSVPVLIWILVTFRRQDAVNLLK